MFSLSIFSHKSFAQWICAPLCAVSAVVPVCAQQLAATLESDGIVSVDCGANEPLRFKPWMTLVDSRGKWSPAVMLTSFDLNGNAGSMTAGDGNGAEVAFRRELLLSGAMVRISDRVAPGELEFRGRISSEVVIPTPANEDITVSLRTAGGTEIGPTPVAEVRSEPHVKAWHFNPDPSEFTVHYGRSKKLRVLCMGQASLETFSETRDGAPQVVFRFFANRHGMPVKPATNEFTLILEPVTQTASATP